MYNASKYLEHLNYICIVTVNMQNNYRPMKVYSFRGIYLPNKTTISSIAVKISYNLVIKINRYNTYPKDNSDNQK